MKKKLLVILQPMRRDNLRVHAFGLQRKKQQ